MSYVHFQLESPSGIVRRRGYSDTSLNVKQGGTTVQSISTATTISKYSANKIATADIQIGDSAPITCGGKIMPYDMVLRTMLTSGKYQKYTSSGTFVVPYGVSQVTVFAVGGGGGGGGGQGNDGNTSAWGGGGGGGGYTKLQTVNVTGGSKITVTVGAGGVGGSGGWADEDTWYPASNGGNGGASSFGSLVVANGGTGGVNGYSTGVGGNGGSGGGNGGYERDFDSDRHPGDGGTNGNNGYQHSHIYGEGGTGQHTSTEYTLNGITTRYSGGGGGGGYDYGGVGGNGGGGRGGWYGYQPVAGTANTGGGGGGGQCSTAYGGRNGAAGGSGIVIVSWA